MFHIPVQEDQKKTTIVHLHTSEIEKNLKILKENWIKPKEWDSSCYIKQ